MRGRAFAAQQVQAGQEKDHQRDPGEPVRDNVLTRGQFCPDANAIDLQKPVKQQSTGDGGDCNTGKVGEKGTLAEFSADNPHAPDIACRPGQQKDEHRAR